MKSTRIRHVLAFFLIVAALFAGPTYANAATGRQLADSAIAALKAAEPASTSKNMALTLGWSWLEVSFNDDTYPIIVDLVGSNFNSAQKVVYLLPGGGVNFSSSFFTPLDSNLAQFFRKAGYLVVGITPREDAVPAGITYDFMTNWGMAKHKADIETIISIIQSRLNKPYRVVGHSFGAAYALDYASTCSDSLFEKVIALDIYSYSYTQAEEKKKADESYKAFKDMAVQPPYVDASYTDMKSLALASLLLPKIDSGEPRDEVGPGNFTFEGLLFFSLIWSKELPGIDVSDWPLVQSYAAGVYNPAWCPLFDSYWLTKSDINNVRSASFMVGSGLVPYAVYRDWFDVNGYSDQYVINWSGKNTPILWINTALGYGSNMAGSFLGSGVPVTRGVVPGYGHLDILLGRNAQDVWREYNLDK